MLSVCSSPVRSFLFLLSCAYLWISLSYFLKWPGPANILLQLLRQELDVCYSKVELFLGVCDLLNETFKLSSLADSSLSPIVARTCPLTFWRPFLPEPIRSAVVLFHMKFYVCIVVKSMSSGRKKMVGIIEKTSVRSYRIWAISMLECTIWGHMMEALALTRVSVEIRRLVFSKHMMSVRKR